MSFESGVVGSLFASFDTCRLAATPHFEIHGTAGSLILGDPNRFDGEVRYRPLGSESWEKVPPRFDTSVGRGIGLADMVEAIRSGRRTSRERRPRVPRAGRPALDRGGDDFGPGRADRLTHDRPAAARAMASRRRRRAPGAFPAGGRCPPRSRGSSGLPARSQVAPRSRVVVSQPSPDSSSAAWSRSWWASSASPASPVGTCRKQTTDSSGIAGQGLEVVGLRASMREVGGEIVVRLDRASRSRASRGASTLIHSFSARQRRVPSNDSL